MSILVGFLNYLHQFFIWVIQICFVKKRLPFVSQSVEEIIASICATELGKSTNMSKNTPPLSFNNSGGVISYEDAEFN